MSGNTGVTALLGPNGAGKTTLLRVILGDLRAAEGTVQVCGEDPQRNRRRLMRKLGWMPQHLRLPGRMNVQDFIIYAGWLKGLGWHSATASSEQILEAVGLSDRCKDAVGSLSGGMQRRAAFAAAIVHKPELLVLDEPMEGLDPEQRSDLAALVKNYAASNAVVLSTHILQDLPKLADQIVVMSEGSERFTGSYASFENSVSSGGLEAAYRHVIRSGL